MNIKFENKRAVITLIGSEPTRNDKRKYSQLIRREQMAWKVAKTSNDERTWLNAERNIKHFRELMKQPEEKIYLMNIYVKQYKTEIKGLTFSYFPAHHNRENWKKFIKECIDQAIRSARINSKFHPIPTHFAGVVATKTGRVFLEEGTILRAHVKKNVHTLYDGKAPTTQKRYVGIELEFCAPIKEEHLALKIFQRGLHKFVQLKKDGSLRPQEKEYAFELALLLEETNYKKGLKKVTNLLSDIKAVVKDRRCGLHVHFDMRHRNKDTVFNNLVACQYALFSIVEPSRYTSEFCEVVRQRKFPTEFKSDNREHPRYRYKAINAAAYYKYRTLEIRMHEGSVDYSDIAHWVDLLLKVVNYSKKLKDDIIELPMLKKRLKLRDKLFNYTIDRSCTWQVQNSDAVRRLRSDIEEIREYGLQRDREETPRRRDAPMPPPPRESLSDRLRRIEMASEQPANREERIVPVFNGTRWQEITEPQPPQQGQTAQQQGQAQPPMDGAFNDAIFRTIVTGEQAQTRMEGAGAPADSTLMWSVRVDPSGQMSLDTETTTNPLDNNQTVRQNR